MSDESAPQSGANGKTRQLEGAPRQLARVALILLTLSGGAWALQLHYYLPFAVFREQYLGLFLGLGLSACFLTVKAHPRESGLDVPWHDWILFAGSVVVGLYIVALYPTISYNLAELTPDRYLLGGLAILLSIEATRRLLGWSLAVIAIVFCLYARFAEHLPGLLYARASSWERISSYLFLDSNGIFGITLAVTATVVVAFIFFGQCLISVRGDSFFTDVGLALMGRFRGGTAKVAVVSSSLFGMVSGSAVSNVVICGTVTIPMMKQAGYRPPLAAAVEAVASTGGQIMPPVMGVAAFIVAEYLSVPYSDVALAALVPAVLYYASLFVQVDFEAAKHGLSGLPRHVLPRLGGVLRRGWIYLIPIAALIYLLLTLRWPAGKAGMAAAILTLLCGAIYPETRAGLRKILDCIEKTGVGLLSLVAISALAGIIIGALQLSGLSFKLSLVLTTIGEDHILIMLGLTAMVCIVLGCGMPTTVVYVLLAVLVAPALVQLGVEPMAAHLFIFYFGMLSMITPPVCIATYAAASLAQTNFWQAGWLGVRLGIVGYLVPFFFVFHPALLLEGPVSDIVITALTALLGIVLLSAGCVGFLLAPLGPALRLVSLAAGGLMFVPPDTPMLIAANLLGAGLGGGLAAFQWWRGPRRSGEIAADARS